MEKLNRRGRGGGREGGRRQTCYNLTLKIVQLRVHIDYVCIKRKVIKYRFELNTHYISALFNYKTTGSFTLKCMKHLSLFFNDELFTPKMRGEGKPTKY